MRKLSASILSLMSGLAAPCVAQVVLYDNGGVITTPTGACIPVGGSSSLLQVVGTIPNGYYGYSHMLTATNNNRIADDFVVPAPGWNIATIEVLDYQTNAPSATSTITGMNVRIWNGKPGVAGSQVVYGDVLTNRLTASVFTNIYRLGSTCDLKRALFKSTVNINTSLAPGTYWLDWQAIGSANYSGPWSPVVTITGQRNKPGSNGIQSLDGGNTWIPIIDDGVAPEFLSPPLPQDLPFVINGTVGSACAANCDGSTTVPVLTANDFQCFLNNYAAGLSSANCDGSTAVPILTANDFQCFLNNYAAGCS